MELRWAEHLQNTIDGMRGAIPNDSVVELSKKRIQSEERDVVRL